MGEVHGCYIAIPEEPLVGKISKISSVICQGNIDFAGETHVSNHETISVTGWTMISGENGIVPEKVYISLTKQNEEPIYFEALQIHRPDVNAHFDQSSDIDSGFSRIINTNSLVGKYDVGIVRLNQEDQLEACQFQKELLISGGSIDE